MENEEIKYHGLEFAANYYVNMLKIKGEGVHFEHDVKKEADEEFTEIRNEYL